MFTGIIKNLGRVEEVTVLDKTGDLELFVDMKNLEKDCFLSPGDSVALSGICLTLVSSKAGRSLFYVSPETVARTTFSDICRGWLLNLEPAMRLDSFMGGHFVQGHVDVVGEVVGLSTMGKSLCVLFSVPSQWLRYMVWKGPVAVDGVSLTLNMVSEKEGLFSVMVIPETFRRTLFQKYKIGDKVNLEVDILSKYTEKLLLPKTN